MEQRSITEVLEEQTPQWMSLPGVIGTALGELDGRECIIVLVTEKNEDLVRVIPESIDGYPVIIRETGEIRALEIE